MAAYFLHSSPVHENPLKATNCENCANFKSADFTDYMKIVKNINFGKYRTCYQV